MYWLYLIPGLNDSHRHHQWSNRATQVSWQRWHHQLFLSSSEESDCLWNPLHDTFWSREERGGGSSKPGGPRSLLGSFSLAWRECIHKLLHCVTTADPTHIEEYTQFYCWYAHALLLCARICNCWNILSSSFVLPVLSYWWTKYQFYNISICQTKPSMEDVYLPKLLLCTGIVVLNYYFASICTYTRAHILVKFGCSWHFWGFSGKFGGFVSASDL